MVKLNMKSGPQNGGLNMITFHILVNLASRLGVFVIIAFLLSQTTPFKKTHLKERNIFR